MSRRKLPATRVDLVVLYNNGLVDEDGNLTPKGELKLHQLEQQKYWNEVAQPKRLEKGVGGVYRCEVCKAKVGPGPKLRHIVRRPDKSIRREVATCPECLTRLNKGEPLADLVKEFSTVIPVGVTAPAPEPPSEPPKVNVPVILGRPVPMSRPTNGSAKTPKPRSRRKAK